MYILQHYQGAEFFLTYLQLRSLLEANFQKEFHADVSKTAWDVMKQFLEDNKVFIICTMYFLTFEGIHMFDYKWNFSFRFSSNMNSYGHILIRGVKIHLTMSMEMKIPYI